MKWYFCDKIIIYSDVLDIDMCNLMFNNVIESKTF